MNFSVLRSSPLPDWTVLRIAGRDAPRFLHNLCTNEIKKLTPGSGCEAFLTNVKARIVGHGLIFADGSETEPSYTLISVPDQAERLLAHLDRYLITEQVELTDRTAERQVIYLAGMEADDALQKLKLPVPPPCSVAAPMTAAPRSEVVVRRVNLLADRDLLLELPAESDIPSQLADAGFTALTTAEFEAARIAACFPHYGVDISEDHLAPEIGRTWGINYRKGCYLGQEPIARIDALGHVNRLFRGLRFPAGTAIEPGAEFSIDGKPIGRFSSVARSDLDTVALTFLRTRQAAQGLSVSVQLPGGQATGLVIGPHVPPGFES